jgi:Cu(I)/Ag(I) efflux system membrane protein CusA/SilA
MMAKIIAWALSHQLIVGLFTVGAVVAGVLAMESTPLEALPDLSDVQVIVQADYGEQAPQIVEDQVTYPITAEMLNVAIRSSACHLST